MQETGKEFIIQKKRTIWYGILFYGALILVINSVIQIFVISDSQAAQINKCSDIFDNSYQSVLTNNDPSNLSPIEIDTQFSAKDLVDHTIWGIDQVPEFLFIRELAEKMGLRVWLFGGTASSFLHYVKWDLARIRGQVNLQKDRFDFDYTNIFRSTQDLDITIDATPEVALTFQKIIAEKYSQFLGSKTKWEVRTLRHRMNNFGEIGYKEALLDDSDFINQNTDSNSLGMVEITFNKNQNQKNEPIIRDLKNWDRTQNSIFLDDTLNNRISYFRSQKHFTTSRGKAGENPEILSVIRLLVKAFQYELVFSNTDFAQLKTIVNEFEPTKITNSNALRRIHETAKKLVMHAVNIEYAVNKMNELGLRQKLMALGDINEIDSDAWWLNREPLRSFQVGKGNGTTAADLNLTIVAHETNNFLAYESISRSHSGEPNVFVSREKATGESAAFGEGFYTRIGREGARGTGLTVRFIVKPEARVGTDFIIQDEYIIFKNKKALTVIQESLNLGINDLLKLAESDKVLQIDHSDLALLEKLKRKMNSNLINDELNKLLISKVEIDHERLVYILNSFQNSNFDKLISKDILGSISKNVFDRISAFANSKNEAELIRYIKTVGPIIKTLHSNGILNKASFINNLKELVQNPSLSFCLRQQAVFELLLLIDDFEHYFNFKKDFESNEIKTLVTEMKEWNKSQDLRKRKFAIQLNKKWSEAIENGDVKSLEAFIEIQLFEINHKTVSHNSILQLAAYYKQKSIIDWLIANPNFNFNTKNNIGLNEVDQLRLSGKGEYADFILQNRPDLQSRKFNLRERNTDQKTTDYPNGTPIIDFIRIEAGSFLMGEGEARVLTTISKPFEIMSVDITQETYRIVVELLKQNFRNGEYNDLNGTPSYFKGSSRPVEQVSYDDITLWIKGLNNLSKLDTEVQKTLEKLFPLHMIGIQYSRPTEAQWEYVSRLGGLAEGEYSHGNSDLNLEEYAVIRWNSSDQTHVVGFKKPVFYNGKPIYDIHGNVWKLIEDWYDTSLTGGKDPQGPNSGSKRIYRGGSWRDGTHVFGSGNRYYTNPSIRNEAVGFRLVRTIL